jgi:outer membrane receptor for ferrienterochelin and colicin
VRALPISLFLGLALSPPARAQEAVSIGASVAVQDEAPGADDQPGLELRGLPVESRTDVTDFVGRNLPGASLSPHGLLLRGGDAGDTAVLVDGFRLRHLALPLALVERLDVATAGYGARWADVAGGTVALTTRRESNRWHAGGEIFHDFRDRVVSDAAASASGPLVRDRLFFLVGVEGAMARESPPLDPFLGRPPQRKDRALAGALKLSWLPNARHRVTASPSSTEIGSASIRR